MGKAPLPHNKRNCYPPYPDHYLSWIPIQIKHCAILMIRGRPIDFWGEVWFTQSKFFWAACGVLWRPIFDCSSGQQIKIHSFSKNKETSKTHKQKLSEIFHSTIVAVQYTARVKWSKSTWRYLWLTQFHACPSSPQHLSFFGKSCKCPTMAPGVHENPTVGP